MSDLGDDGVTRIGVAGALAREYLADQHRFLEILAGVLQRSLGDYVQVKYSGGFLSKRQLKGIALAYDDYVYALEKDGTRPIRATMTHTVRGITLKTETISVEEWVKTVSALIESSAAQHASARTALEEMLGL